MTDLKEGKSQRNCLNASEALTKPLVRVRCSQPSKPEILRRNARRYRRQARTDRIIPYPGRPNHESDSVTTTTASQSDVATRRRSMDWESDEAIVVMKRWKKNTESDMEVEMKGCNTNRKG